MLRLVKSKRAYPGCRQPVSADITDPALIHIMAPLQSGDSTSPAVKRCVYSRSAAKLPVKVVSAQYSPDNRCLAIGRLRLRAGGVARSCFLEA
jgi:hypothetical protein